MANNLDSIIQQAATQYGLDPALLRAQLSVEDASGSPTATSSAGAVGPAQLMPATAVAMGVDPHDPAQAIPAMARIMAANLKAYGGDMRTALMAYHGGPNQKLWGPKTQAYPGLVLAQYQQNKAPSAPAVSFTDTLKQRIDSARSAGFSDDQIWQGLAQIPDMQGKLKAAQGAGFGPESIQQALGLSLGQQQGEGQTQGTGQIVTSAPVHNQANLFTSGGILHPLTVAGGALLHGALVTAGIPGDIEKFAGGWADKLSGVNGQSPFSDQSTTLFPTSENMLQLGRSAGLVDQAAELPQGPIEQKIATGAEGMGAALPALPFGGDVLPALAAGGAGALTAQSVAEGSTSPATAALIGGAIGGTAGAGLVNAGSRVFNILRGAQTPEAQAFGTLGLDVPSAGYVSSSKEVGKVLAPSGDAQADTESKLGQILDNTASSISPARTLQDAGTVAQSEARDWLQNTLPAKVSAAWAPIDQNVPASLPVNLDGFDKVLGDIHGQGGQLSDVVDLLKSNVPAQIKAKLAAATIIADPTTGQLVKKAPSWGDVAMLSSALGEARGIPDVVRSIGEKNLSKMYAALMGDRRAALENLGSAKAEQLGAYEAGPEAVLGGQGITPEQMAALKARVPDLVQKFDEANAESTRLYGIAKNTMGRIVSGTNAAQESIRPEDAAKALLQGGKRGATTLGQVATELPQTAKALAATQIRQMGLAEPDSLAPVVSKKFSQQWNGLSPEAKEALFPDPTMRTRLDAASIIAQRVKEVGTQQVAGRLLFGPGEVGSGILGGEMGYQLGELLSYMHGGSSSGEVFGPAAAAGLAGIGLPYAYRKTANALANSPEFAQWMGAPALNVRGAKSPLWYRPSTLGTTAAVNTLYPAPNQ